jgi:hypothetical protein
VLIECNGLPVDGAAALESVRHQDETELEMVVLRQGEAVELTVQIEARPEREHRMIMQHQTLDTSMPLVDGELF